MRPHWEQDQDMVLVSKFISKNENHAYCVPGIAGRSTERANGIIRCIGRWEM